MSCAWEGSDDNATVRSRTALTVEVVDGFFVVDVTVVDVFGLSVVETRWSTREPSNCAVVDWADELPAAVVDVSPDPALDQAKRPTRTSRTAAKTRTSLFFITS